MKPNRPEGLLTKYLVAWVITCASFNVTTLALSGDSLLSCKTLLEQIAAGKVPIPRLAYEEKFAVADRVSLYRYKSNVWGLADDDEPDFIFTHWLMLGNLPTGDRDDVLYLMGHGSHRYPAFRIQRHTDLLAPSKILNVIKSTVDIGKFKAVVLISCFGASFSDRIVAHPVALEISHALKLPVISARGSIKIYLQTTKNSDLVVSPNDARIWIEDRDPGKPAWAVIEASNSKSDFSIDQLKEISNFYVQWEAMGHAKPPVDDVEDSADGFDIIDPP